MLANIIDRFQCELGSYRFDCVWAPGQTLPEEAAWDLLRQAESVNDDRAQPLRYGVFTQSKSRKWKLDFLKHSIWCIVSGADGPCGYAYHYSLGPMDGKQIIHAGLVGFNQFAGRDLVTATSFCLILGNLINFDSYICTNITHIPLLASLFWTASKDAFPAPPQPSLELHRTYLPVLERLVDEYILPILECRPESVCRDSFRILGSPSDIDAGFETRRNILPAALCVTHGQFMDNWLRVRNDDRGHSHVLDDLILIGTFTADLLRTPLAASLLKRLTFTFPPDASLRAMVASRIGRDTAQQIYGTPKT